MDEVEIIGFPGGNFVRAVRMAAAEKQIPYRLTHALPHAPEAMAVHPLGKVPAMRHGAVRVCESRAIIGYFERIFPDTPLLPTEPVVAAEAEQWISMITTSIDRTMIRDYDLNYIFPNGQDEQPDRAVIDRATVDLKPRSAC